MSRALENGRHNKYSSVTCIGDREDAGKMFEK